MNYDFERKYFSISRELLNDFLHSLSALDDYLYEGVNTREDCKQLGKYEYLKGKLYDALKQQNEPSEKSDQSNLAGEN